MKRKVIQIAGSTQLVSLPRQWAKRHNILKGAELDVEERGNKVIISAGRESHQMNAKINIDAFGKLGMRPIGALFKSGCDEIELTYSDSTKIADVEKVLRELVGFEIVTQTENSCTIKQISYAEETEFDGILNRTFLLLFSIADECLSNIRNHRHDLLMNVSRRDVTINKLTNFCRRILNKHGYKEFRKTPTLYYIVEEIENLGDEYKELAQYIHAKKIKVANDDILKLFADINLLFRAYVSLFNKFQNKQAKEFAETVDKVAAKMDKMLDKATVEEIRVIEALNRMKKIIFNLSGPLLTMKIPELQTDYMQMSFSKRT